MRHLRCFMLFALITSYCLPVFGQQDAAFYKQKAEECLSRGECDKAQIMYDTWKQVSGSRDNYIEARITACKTAQRQSIHTPPATLQVGQEHTLQHVDRNGYERDISGRIAYLDATKRHGLKVRAKSIFTRMEAFTEREILCLRRMESGCQRKLSSN